jgi:glycine cleavage system H protein
MNKVLPIKNLTIYVLITVGRNNMKIENFEFPENIFYHEEHCWAKKDGDVIVIGMTDFAQKLAGTIKRVVTLEEDEEVSQGKPCGTLSSGKWTGKIYSPISGEITEVNEELEDEPKLINDDPYGEGWILKIEPSNEDELNNLMNASKVSSWFPEELKKEKYKAGLEKMND